MTILLCVSFFPVFAQSPAPYQRDFAPKSPEASAFNKYGDIGVSQFTGSPNVSFPLNLSEEVPISISYNASGNKPEEHHGWVGAGFNLNVGGMISRIKRGALDEYKDVNDNTDKEKPYIENNWMLKDKVPNTTWDGDALLTAKVTYNVQNPPTDTNLLYPFRADLEPDEFVFNFNNFSGSFMLNHEDKWVFRGNNPAEFKVTNVNIQKDIWVNETNTLPVKYARAIMGFTIVASDGTEYTFGGDDSSVDFTYSLAPISSPDNMYKSMLPMGWHLTKIKPVSGKEINFVYVKDQFSVVLNSTRNLGYLNANHNSQNQIGAWNGTEKSITLLRNAYLSEIQTLYETIKFEKSVLTATDADDYPIESTLLPQGTLLQIHNTYGVDLTQRKWFKLNAIKTYNKATTPTVLRHFALEYIKSNSNRLQLKKVRQIDVDKINYASTTPPVFDGTNSIPVVEFEYNMNALPPYNSGKIDHWGYYSNVADGTPVPTTSSEEAVYYASREPHPINVQAEILSKIIYPTGGFTTLEFEPHSYSASFLRSSTANINKAANTAFDLQTETSDKPAGGLRIKKIISSDGVNTVEKTYKYVKNYSNTNTTEVSSGILGSVPEYYDKLPSGTQIAEVTFNQYAFLNEQTLNTLNLTSGSPVTYSEVVEINKDNSYTIFKFSNYDSVANCNRKALKVKTKNSSKLINPIKDPVMDYEHLRGRLIEEKRCKDSNLPVQKTVNEYTTTLDDATAIRVVQTQAILIEVGGYQGATEVRATAYLIHTSPVFLLKTTKTDYYYDPTTQASSAVVTTVQNTYDTYKNIREQAVTSTDSRSDATTTYRYAYDNATDVSESAETAGSKELMVTQFMIGIPLVTSSNFKNGSKIEYKGFNNGTATDKLLPFIFYSQNRTGGFTEAFRINSYTDYDKPTQTKAKGTNTPVVTYSWTNGLLNSKTFGTGVNQLTWTYNYDVTKRWLTDKKDENGLRMKFGYDGYRRLSTVTDRYKLNGTTVEDPQATTQYTYQLKDATNPYSFIGTSSSFKNVVTPLSTKQYMDGLGRPISVVKENYTPSGLNQINNVMYDGLGRQYKTYLPFESNTLPSSAAYVQTTYEVSPLSRPISQTNVDGSIVSTNYGTNTAADAVQIMTATAGGANALVSAGSSSVYAANSLYKTTMTDENGKITCVFKDKLGRIVLTRRFLNGASGTNVDMYNVYDDYGQLVVVVPPGSVVVSGSTASVISDITFQYKYDNLNRLSAKKIPSAAAQKFYYDSRDLLVLTQDGNMLAAKNANGDPEPKHLATLYDNIGRVVKTGFVIVSPTEGVDYTTDIATLTMDKLTENIYYDNSTWVKHQGAQVLTPTGVTTERTFVWSYIERRLATTAYNGNPGWTGKQHVMSKTYRNGTVQPEGQINDADTEGVNWMVSDYDGMQKPMYAINYLFAGYSSTQVRTFQRFTYDNGHRLTATKYFYALNGAGIAEPTFTLSNMVYNFKDQLIEKNIGLNGANSLQSIDYTYNLRGWLTNINNVALYGGTTTSIMTPQGTGSGTIQNLAISPFINQAIQEAVQPYKGSLANELPPLLDDTNSDLFSQNITYDNPASQTGAAIQRNGNISSTTWQVLGRDKQAHGFTYDGLDRLTQANYFDITEAYQGGQYVSTYSTDNKFQEAVQYDLRGNITGLQRYGLNGGSWTANGYTAATYGMIDNLGYGYVRNADSQNPMIKSNKLLQVTDFSMADKGFKFNTTSRTSVDQPDYTYDDNGNLTSDRHKYITEIKYNYLNLPMSIKFDKPGSTLFGGTIEFAYDATGVKLKKVVTYKPNTNRATEIYDYINGVEYKNYALQRIAHTEGAVITNANGAHEHEYVLRDHLGNVRVTFSDGISLGDPYQDWVTWQMVDPNNSSNNPGYNDGVITSNDIKQINHFYSFGLNMEGNWQGGAAGNNKYQYNEKQWNDDFGLGLYDYGARFYDPALGRWNTIDPLAEKFMRYSPYNYALDNPLRFIDPNGMESTPADGNIYSGGPDDPRDKRIKREVNTMMIKESKKGNPIDEIQAQFMVAVKFQKANWYRGANYQGNGNAVHKSPSISKTARFTTLLEVQVYGKAEAGKNLVSNRDERDLPYNASFKVDVASKLKEGTLKGGTIDINFNTRGAFENVQVKYQTSDGEKILSSAFSASDAPQTFSGQINVSDLTSNSIEVTVIGNNTIGTGDITMPNTYDLNIQVKGNVTGELKQTRINYPIIQTNY